MPLISVILCTNKVNAYFFQAIDSLLNQEFKEFEIILVFNKVAADLILSVKEKYINNQKIFYLENYFNYVNFSINQGLSIARGKYIARMDADDISYPNRLSVQYNFLKKNPNVDICGSWYNYIDDNGEAIKLVKTPTSNKLIRAQLFFCNPICHPSTMYKRDLILQAGGYINSIYSEDYDLWLRLSTIKNVQFRNIAEPLIGYRNNPTGEARGSLLAYKSFATSQFNQFLITGNVIWLISVFLTSIKILINI